MSGADARLIAITGGPAAGKSTGMSALRAALAQAGYHAAAAPEFASVMFDAIGREHVPGLLATDEGWRAVQGAVIDMQVTMQRSLAAFAEAVDRPLVSLVDRGVMDACAYSPPGAIDQLAESRGLRLPDLRDSYHAVVHLVSAARGAEHAYTTANNPNRRETVQEAADVDVRTLRAWLGHPRLLIVPNPPGGFDAKIADLRQVVLSSLDSPPQQRVWRLGEHAEWLPGDDDPSSVRAQRLTVRWLSDGRRLTWRREGGHESPLLSDADHDSGRPVAVGDARLLERDTAPGQVRLRRVWFEHEHAAWHLDTIDDGPKLLSCRLARPDQHCSPPAWAGDATEVTGTAGGDLCSYATAP